MRNLENLKRQLAFYKKLQCSFIQCYTNLPHDKKMNSDIIYSINIVIKRIKNLHININQLNQKL